MISFNARLLLVVAILSLSDIADSFTLPIETVMQMERAPLSKLFKGLDKLEEEKIDYKDFGLFMTKYDGQPYTSLLLRGMMMGMGN
eukprot:GFUD01083454.1.p1 GENE.GFUD01083454.1~~GFUD01083454.1.p1  ORF type:complete len:101 (-),score=22.96 GFUD01083454.1:49-306(-)